METNIKQMNKTKSFGVYIHRVLKKVNPSRHITATALEAVDSILRTTTQRLVTRSLQLTDGVAKKTVSGKELRTAAGLVFPAGLAERSVSASNDAIAAFSASEAEREESGVPVEKAQTRESRCGLTVSVSAAEKYLRNGNAGHVASNAPIVLAAMIENLASQLLSLSSNVSMDVKRKTITVRHLFLGVSTDSELQKFVASLGIVFLDAGVNPHIEEKLLQKKPRKRLPPTKDGVKRPHRWRPGTKTLMNMRKIQKDSQLLMQHAPFARLTREVAEEYKAGLRCTGDFLSSLQSIVENRIVRVMESANRIAIHSNRETVYSRDVELARSFIEHALPKFEVTYESNIPEAALRKMALRAGIKRYGDDSSDTYRELMVNFLESYLRDIVTCATHHNLQTLNTRLLVEALGMRGLHPTIVPHKRKAGKKGGRSSSKAEKDEENVSDIEKEAIETVPE